MAESLDKLNRARTAHYYTEQRDVLNALQAMDESRNDAVVAGLVQTTDLFFEVKKEEHGALTRATDACSQFKAVRRLWRC